MGATADGGGGGAIDRRMTAEADDPLLLAFLRGLEAAAEIVAELPGHLDVAHMDGLEALAAAGRALRGVAASPEALLRASRRR